jgi:hypothetical protein
VSNAQLDDAPPREFPPDEAYADEPPAQSAVVVPMPAKRAAPTNSKVTAPASDETRTGKKSEIGPLALLWFATLNEVRHQEYLVKGLLLAQTLFVVFGESNSGKTFWVLDLCLALASRRDWHGRKTKGGLVLYVALEGASSVRTRVAAYRKANPDVQGVPFAIIPEAIDLLDNASVDRLIASARAAQSECGEPVVAIIFDTFARSMPGGDENSAQDVGTVVAAADRIRTELSCAVGFIHHAGKDPSKGARGSSALRAACDTEILIEGQTGPRTATVTKQRDLVCGEKFGFTLKTVDLGADPEGDRVTSCVLEHADVIATTRQRVSSKNQSAILSAMQEFHREHPDRDGLISSIDLRAIGNAQGLTRSRVREAVEGLERYGWVRQAAAGVRFIPEEA